MKLYNPLLTLKKREWALWLISLFSVVLSNILTGEFVWSTALGSIIGVTALIFIAKGDVWGQILTVLFSILYGVTSYRFRYYGEMITYLGMTMPSAVMSVISWIKNPYEKAEKTNEVKISKLSKFKIVIMIILTVLVTQIFYYILKYFDTPNLFFSTVSVLTSFLASYLMILRNSYYAVAYAFNDIVLVILWIMATSKDFSYLPMVICFIMFFINDIYGFLSWKKREKRQSEKYFKT